MAVRIDASGDYLRRTANLPTVSAFTLCCWVYYDSTRPGQYNYVLGLEDGTSFASHGFQFGFDSSQILNLYDDAGADPRGSTPSTGTWNFMAMVGNGTGAGALKGYHMTQAGVWQTLTGNIGTSFTPAMAIWGNDSYDEWGNFRIVATKMWDAALTLAEVEREALTLMPARYANLNLWSPNFPGATERLLDYSGNGRNLTAGGTLTDEDPPPVSYGAFPQELATPTVSLPVNAIRFSTLFITSPWRQSIPVPDSTISARDRATLLYRYGGITAAGAGSTSVPVLYHHRQEQGIS